MRDYEAWASCQLDLSIRLFLGHWSQTRVHVTDEIWAVTGQARRGVAWRGAGSRGPKALNKLGCTALIGRHTIFTCDGDKEYFLVRGFDLVMSPSIR